MGAAAVDLLTRHLAELDRARPEGRRRPENLVVLRRAVSTNLLARGIVADYEGEEQSLRPLLIIALEQSGGRGRQGRSWASPAGRGVYATRVLSLQDPELLQALPMLAGVGLCRALSNHLPLPCRLKWPNDLVVDTAEGRRKIGGILIEARVHPGEGAAAIIGFGVNHSQEAGDLPETATSVQQLGGPGTGAKIQSVSLAELTWDLVDGLESELARLEDLSGAVESYRELSVHRPGDAISCRLGEQIVKGAFLGFDERGRLRLDRDGEETLVASGEVIE